MPSSLDRPTKKQKLEASAPQSTLIAPPTEFKTLNSAKSSSAQPLLEQQQPVPSREKEPRQKKKLKTKQKDKGTGERKPKTKKAASAVQPQAVPSSAPARELRTGQEVKERVESALQSQERPTDWWGAKKFVTGGCLGGLNDQETSRSRKSFTEDTQEQLYLTSQAAKTAGKKGLGAGQGQHPSI